jgi:ferritin-like metal-binding protein YciE
MAKMKKLEDLFHDTLKDIYFAEKKILTSLPKMAKAAQHADLKAAFEKHWVKPKVKSNDWNRCLPKLIRSLRARLVMPSSELQRKARRSWKNIKACPPMMRVCSPQLKLSNTTK